jgi:hypothetical protein
MEMYVKNLHRKAALYSIIHALLLPFTPTDMNTSYLCPDHSVWNCYPSEQGFSTGTQRTINGLTRYFALRQDLNVVILHIELSTVTNSLLPLSTFRFPLVTKNMRRYSATLSPVRPVPAFKRSGLCMFQLPHWITLHFTHRVCLYPSYGSHCKERFSSYVELTDRSWWMRCFMFCDREVLNSEILCRLTLSLAGLIIRPKKLWAEAAEFCVCRCIRPYHTAYIYSYTT